MSNLDEVSNSDFSENNDHPKDNHAYLNPVRNQPDEIQMEKQFQQACVEYPDVAPSVISENSQQNGFNFNEEEHRTAKQCLIVLAVIGVVVAISLAIAIPISLTSVNTNFQAPCPTESMGTFKVDMSWTPTASDVDLHIIQPDGTHVYYSHKEGRSGRILQDKIVGPGPETYQSFCVHEGTFRVFVTLYDGVSSTHATISVVAGETQFSISKTISNQRARYQICSIQVRPNEDGESFTFTIRGT